MVNLHALNSFSAKPENLGFDSSSENEAIFFQFIYNLDYAKFVVIMPHLHRIKVTVLLIV